MPTELELWSLLGHFVCVMFQTNKQTNKQNEVNLLYWGISKRGTL